MTDIKRNVRDGAYVALGACALGISSVAKKREKFYTGLNKASSQIKPKIDAATENITNRISTNVAPMATNVFNKVKQQSESALNSTIKIAQEAKKRIK